jgi:hypothetical protein
MLENPKIEDNAINGFRYIKPNKIDNIIRLELKIVATGLIPLPIKVPDFCVNAEINLRTSTCPLVMFCSPYNAFPISCAFISKQEDCSFTVSACTTVSTTSGRQGLSPLPQPLPQAFRAGSGNRARHQHRAKHHHEVVEDVPQVQAAEGGVAGQDQAPLALRAQPSSNTLC